MVKIKKGLVFCVVATLLFSVSFVGCSASKNEGQQITNSLSKEEAVKDTKIATGDLSTSSADVTTVDTSVKGSITYWTWDKAAPYYAERFTKMYPNTKVTVNVIPGDYFAKIRQMLSSGVDVPDVLMQQNYGVEANDSALENLSEPPYNAQQYKSKFYAFWYNSGVGTDGKLRIMPNAPGMSGNFYRRDVAKDLLGTDDPTQVGAALKDWQTVYDLGVKLKQISGGKKFIIGSGTDVVNTMNAQTGKPYVNGTKLDFSIILNSLEMGKKFRAAGLDAKAEQWTPAQTACMKAGTILMYPSGSWYEAYGIVANVGTSQDGLWGVTSTPGGNVSTGGNGFSIPVKAKNKDLAWKFIEFATMNPAMQADQLKKFSCFPAMMSAASDPYFSLPVPLFKGQARTIFSDLAKNMIFTPVTKYDTAINTILAKYTPQVLTGKITPQQAIDTATKETLSQFPELHK